MHISWCTEIIKNFNSIIEMVNALPQFLFTVFFSFETGCPPLLATSSSTRQ